ncbi:MAG: lysine--tRNA ligase, partial [Acidimicrobiia bacterium]|nr:lysine--tRNA ligase [Acidimicrobiia bacterium]
MTTEHEERLSKLNAWRASGGAYPVDFRPTAEAAELHTRYPDLEPETSTGDAVSVAGRIMGMRNLGKLSFGVLQDRSGR